MSYGVQHQPASDREEEREKKNLIAKIDDLKMTIKQLTEAIETLES